MFGRGLVRCTTGSYEGDVEKLAELIRDADALVIGAGAGLSTAAGYIYTGERFNKYFADFRDRYGIRDIYSGGFYPFPDMETYWAWWSRHIWVNRYAPVPSDLYERLLSAVEDKDYFVITTNVDHCFQRAGFDKERLFYTQGDYGLLQSIRPRGASAGKTYDNEDIVREMLLAQGFEIRGDGELVIPEGKALSADADKGITMQIPRSMVPVSPDDGSLLTTNLRADDSFVEDAGWHAAQARYKAFLDAHTDDRVIYLELGVGGNTPVIIKYPFWGMTLQNPNAIYVCINKGEAAAPERIADRALCMDADISQVIRDLRK